MLNQNNIINTDINNIDKEDKKTDEKVESKKPVINREKLDKEKQVEIISKSVTNILEALGEDVNREGLLKTPERVSKAMLFFVQGESMRVEDVLNDAIFDAEGDGMVIVKDIDLFSMCEHHMVPFWGKCHIAYIPDKKVIGLSKLARISEMFSRRLQIQERITKQIAEFIQEHLKPIGVACIIEATHMCMVMRGVQKSGSFTTTSYMLGEFRENSKTRAEFLQLLNKNKN